MRFYDLLVLSTRMFKAKTSRTLLTILGMGIGIGAILFLVSLGYGIQKTILERITTADSLLTLDVTSKSDSNAKLDGDSISKIKSQPGIAEISPALKYNAQVKVGDVSSELSSVITTPAYLRLSGIKMEQGAGLSDNSPENIVIASSVARLFGKNPGELVGQELQFTFFIPDENNPQPVDFGGSNIGTIEYESDKKFKVVGIVNEERNNVYINYNSLPDLNSKVLTSLKVKCQSSGDIETVRSSLINAGYNVSSLSQTVDQLNKVFTVVKIVLMLFGIIALVVSAIGMFNTMTIALLERTEEIGIMKSIGASDMTIYVIFIMESTIMGFLGGIFGIAIGWLEGKIFNSIINFIATHFGGEKVSLFYSPLWFILTIIAFSAFVGFITGVIPAQRAARTDPLEALRYK